MTKQSLKCHKAAILLGGHSSRMGGQPKFLLKDGKGRSYLKKQIKALEKQIGFICQQPMRRSWRLFKMCTKIRIVMGL